MEEIIFISVPVFDKSKVAKSSEASNALVLPKASKLLASPAGHHATCAALAISFNDMPDNLIIS